MCLLAVASVTLATRGQPPFPGYMALFTVSVLLQEYLASVCRQVDIFYPYYKQPRQLASSQSSCMVFA